MKSKLFILLSLAVVTLTSAGCYQQDHQLLRPKVESESTQKISSTQTSYTTPLKVGDKNILVEVANTDSSREQGLATRSNLANNNGMLFDFSNTSISFPSFWMKNMNFSLDLIWINNKKIVGITTDVPPPTAEQNLDDSKLPTYYPPTNITSVLEVASGWTKKNNVHIGDVITLN